MEWVATFTGIRKGLSFAVAALGEKSYGESYCGGGIKIDQRVEALGASKLQEPLRLDMEKVFNVEENITSWGVILANEIFSKAA